MIRWPALWQKRKAYVVEGFLIFNLAFLAIDILLAHAENGFAKRAEWIPFVFSLAAALVAGPVFAISLRAMDLGKGKALMILLGFLSILVGIGGLVFHLQSQFMREQTIKHLVYTAPFAAPLAYCGIGSLLIFNRLYPRDEGWAFGIAFGAFGGFFGNFVLTLCDHAQNGFFAVAEWVAVATAALGTGFMAAAILVGARSKKFLTWLLAVLVLQVAVGVVGFLFHAHANLTGPTSDVLARVIHGAPAFAPLLFVNLSILAGFAWIDWWQAKRAE